MYQKLTHLGIGPIYIRNNQDYIPNYGELYRNKERIATSFVESTVNQVVSKRMAKSQQMAWTERGVHLLLQVRTRVLNRELEETFRGWYPKFRCEESVVLAAAACPPDFGGLLEEMSGRRIKPLLVLYALGQLQAGAGRLIPFDQLDRPLVRAAPRGVWAATEITPSGTAVLSPPKRRSVGNRGAHTPHAS
jgi:hypothetical protein